MFQGSLVVVAVVRAMRVAVVDVVGVIAVVDGDVAAALAVLVGVVFVDVVIAHGCTTSLLLGCFLTVLDRVGGDVGDVGDVDDVARCRGAA